MLRLLEWVGSSLEDLRRFPVEVRQEMGFALYQAQLGLKHGRAIPMAGLGAGVLEVVSRFDGRAFRAVYTVRFAAALYVLHAFEKKPKRGIATPKAELDLVRQRLKAAEAHHARYFSRGGRR